MENKILDLNKIKARAEKASPKMKRFGNSETGYTIELDGTRREFGDFVCLFWGRDEMNFENASANSDLFAHARQDILDLVAEVERLQTEVAELNRLQGVVY